MKEMILYRVIAQLLDSGKAVIEVESMAEEKKFLRRLTITPSLRHSNSDGLRLRHLHIVDH